MYQDALEQLGEPQKTQVEERIGEWRTEGDTRWSQIADNIIYETALSPADFAALLRTFCGELDKGADPAGAWITACRAHQFKGRQMTDDERPGMLGRALPFGAYVAFVHRVVRRDPFPINEGAAEGIVRRVCLAGDAGQAVSGRDERFLREALLGKHVIWAFFDLKAPDENPFDRLPRTAEAVRTALGLGHIDKREAIVLLSYKSKTEYVRIEPHRPTIAEAANNSHYRPGCDTNERHGWTRPLSPNPLGLEPQPEVVHGETTGETLVFPIYRCLGSNT